MSTQNAGDLSPVSESKRFEIICAVTLAILAALLAITDLGAGKYGDDEIMGTNEKANIYSWYQSKSVKQSLVEGQRDMIMTLIASGSIKEENLSTLENLLKNMEEDVSRFKKEKNELLLGSSGVGEENWVQEVDGQLGKVLGAKEWERKLDVLARAGDKFDLAVLFLQLSLVMGAISLVLQGTRLKWTFYGIMLLMGTTGIAFSIVAFLGVMALARDRLSRSFPWNHAGTGICKMSVSINSLGVGIILAGIFLMTAGFCASAGNSYLETPLGRQWQEMHNEVRTLTDQLPADQAPQDSRDARRRVEVMTRIVAIYSQGHILFKGATPVTGSPDEERQWQHFMARSCRVHSDNWRKNASAMEGTANLLRSQGK